MIIILLSSNIHASPGFSDRQHIAALVEQFRRRPAVRQPIDQAA
jgi:hypothetical protein